MFKARNGKELYTRVEWAQHGKADMLRVTSVRTTTRMQETAAILWKRPSVFEVDSSPILSLINNSASTAVPAANEVLETHHSSAHEAVPGLFPLHGPERFLADAGDLRGSSICQELVVRSNCLIQLGQTAAAKVDTGESGFSRTHRS